MVGKINVQRRAAAGGQSPASGAQPTAFSLPPSLPGLQPTTVPSAPLQFGGQASIPATGAGQAAQSPNPQTTAFQSADHQSSTPRAPIENRRSEIGNLVWGATAAAAAGAFAAEALRRKKEREQEIEDYYRSRPVKIEAEGKGGRLTGGQIARAYQNAMNQFKAKLQQAQTLGMSAEQVEQLNDDVAKSGKIGASLSAAKEYIARLEEKIKHHYRRPSDDQPPPDAVTIPPLTAEQHAALKNWNTAAQVVTYGFTTLVGALSVFIATKNPWLGIVGAVAGAMWGAYEVSCLTSVQEEFDAAYERSGSVTVWREGWRFNVDANSGDNTYTQANGPLSALYVAGTTLILTGKIP